MKIVILNGNPSTQQTPFNSYVQNLAELLRRKNHDVTLFNLQDKNINFCIGCYHCWLKTPGICVFKDDMPEIIKAYLAADVVLMASPLIMGFVSARLKSVQERMLPLVHPYLQISDDRMSHVARYQRYPAKALLLDGLKDAKAGTLEILEKVNASGGKHEFLFTLTMEQSVEEAACAFDNL